VVRDALASLQDGFATPHAHALAPQYGSTLSALVAHE